MKRYLFVLVGLVCLVLAAPSSAVIWEFNGSSDPAEWASDQTYSDYRGKYIEEYPLFCTERDTDCSTYPIGPGTFREVRDGSLYLETAPDPEAGESDPKKWDRLKIGTIRQDFTAGTYKWRLYLPNFKQDSQAYRDEEETSWVIGAWLLSPEGGKEIDFEIGWGQGLGCRAPDGTVNSDAENYRAASAFGPAVGNNEYTCFMVVQPKGGVTERVVRKIGIKKGWHTLQLQLTPSGTDNTRAAWSIDDDEAFSHILPYSPETAWRIMCSVEFHESQWCGIGQPRTPKYAFFDWIEYISAECPQGGPLDNKVDVDIRTTEGCDPIYTFDVPVGAAQLKVQLKQDKNSNLTLYTWQGQEDTGEYECVGSGRTQTCVAQNPGSGLWSIKVGGTGSGTLQASYSGNTYTLRLEGEGDGKVSIDYTVYDLPAEIPVARDATIEMTAIPGTNSAFVQWSEGSSTWEDNPTTITMDGDKTITALFEKIDLNLTLVSVGQGMGAVRVAWGETEATYDSFPVDITIKADSQVTLEAIPAEESEFAQWEYSGSASGENPLSIVLDQNLEIGFRFDLIPTEPQTIIVTMDTSIKSDWPDRNYGDWDKICSGIQTTQNGGDNRAYIYYDLSGLPANASRATVRLYSHHYPGDGQSSTGDVSVYQVTEPWEEMAITWNTAAAYVASPVTVFTVTHIQEWFEFDITDLYNNWKSGTPNYGLMLNTTTGSGYRPGLFRSKEWSDSTYWPQLVVEP